MARNWPCVCHHRSYSCRYSCVVLKCWGCGGRSRRHGGRRRGADRIWTFHESNRFSMVRGQPAVTGSRSTSATKCCRVRRLSWNRYRRWSSRRTQYHSAARSRSVSTDRRRRGGPRPRRGPAGEPPPPHSRPVPRRHRGAPRRAALRGRRRNEGRHLNVVQRGDKLRRPHRAQQPHHVGGAAGRRPGAAPRANTCARCGPTSAGMSVSWTCFCNQGSCGVAGSSRASGSCTHGGNGCTSSSVRGLTHALQDLHRGRRCAGCIFRRIRFDAIRRAARATHGRQQPPMAPLAATPRPGAAACATGSGMSLALSMRYHL